MHQNRRVELVDDAFIGLYIKLRQRITFEMNVMQKLPNGKIKYPLHVVACTQSVLHLILQIKHYNFIQGRIARPKF